MRHTKSSPLDDARLAVVLSEIRTVGGFLFTNDWYRRYRESGLTRQQVDRAMNVLARRGDIVLQPTPRGVRVTVPESGK